MKILFLFTTLIVCSTCQTDWWQTAQFYQIYPRSYKDSNGDGIGDLNGITANLQHLKDIGVTAAWLSPIFESPMVDFGYDISDFYAIQPEYGTMQDFDNLIKRANQLGIKIILDFVPNHSSDKSEWFVKSVNREKGFEDFYVWHSGKPDPKNSTNRLPPTNWLQAFRGSAWEWVPKRQQFYYHQYTVQQPDLNYRNPLVVAAMTDVLRFWLDRGVAGFRVDAVPCLFEVLPDKNGNYPDEPISGHTNDSEARDYLSHIYTRDQPETIDLIYRSRAFLDQYQKQHGGDTRVFLAETYSAIDVIAQYYGNATHKGAHLPFNFNFITKTNNTSKADDFVKAISLWMDSMPRGSTPNWVLGNHDQRRVGSRYGPARIDQLNMLLMILPGASVTYNGEEIGMEDVNISWEETKDPAACNSNPQIYQQFSRDPARTPLQWDDSKNAGFSTANKTWLPINANYRQVNVKVESQATRSHLKIYKDLVALRKSKTLQSGRLSYKALNSNVLVVERSLPGSETIVLVMNIGKSTQIVKLDNSLPTTLKCRISSVGSKRNPGDLVLRPLFALDAFEALVLSS